MQEKTVDKIKNLVGRTFVSLPAATDLPRLLKHLRVYVVEGSQGKDNNNESNLEASQIYPSAASNEDSIVNNLFHLTLELTRVLSGENDAQTVRDTFFTAFKKDTKEPASPAVTLRSSDNNDGIDNLPDPKLKEALRYLPTAFTGSTSSGSFLFKLDKPAANILLTISDKGVRVEFKNAIDPKAQDEVDCTLSCSGAVLTAIISGMLPPITVIQNGQLKVDNMAKLMVFSKSFKFDKEAFEKYKVQQKNLIAMAKDHSEDTVAVSNNMKKYYTEVLGDDNRVVKVLKAINSATVSPAIIELKFALGVNYMTKDVPNTWKWDIYLYPNDKIVLKSRKSEQDLKNLFKYTWELSITLDWKALFVTTSLSIIHLLFLEGASGQNASQRDNIVKVLVGYASKQVIDSALNNFASVEPGPHLVNSNNKVQVEKYPNGDQYEGEFNEKGLRHGKGVYTTPSGDVYVGTYVDGQREGYGTYTMSDGTRYEGEFKNGFPNGKGIYVFSNGDVYTGEFRDDEFHGEGTWSSPDGSNYQGEFSSGKRHGKGVFFSRGSTYDGEWNVGTFHGYGIYLYINDDMYEGEFRNGKFNGYGRYTVSATGQVIEGEFKDGKPVGVAVETKKLDKPQISDESKSKFEKWREENAKTIEARKKLLITLSRRSLS